MFPDSYTEEDVVLTWEDNLPVELNTDELYLSQIELKDTNTDRCIALYKTGRLLTNNIFKHARITFKALIFKSHQKFLSFFFFLIGPLVIFPIQPDLEMKWLQTAV